MALSAEDIAALRSYEAETTRLQDYGLPPFGSTGYLAAFMASQQKRKEMFEVERQLRLEIDRTLLPKLMEAYVEGSEAERDAIRDLLQENGKVAWGLGWADASEANAPASAARLKRKLLLFAMKNGIADYRDEIMTLAKYVADATAIGLDAGALLREAAQYASDAPRGSRASVRATLLKRAVELSAST